MPPSAQSEPSQHRLAQVARAARGCCAAFCAGDDPVDHLDAARRADAAGRALAAALDGAELHREARPARPCRRCRRTPRCRRGRPCAVVRGERLVVERHVEQRLAASRRRAGRRPARPGSAGRWRCRRRSRTISSRSVRPKAFSTSPPCLMLPASWNGSVPRERPMPKSRVDLARPRRGSRARSPARSRC